MNNYIADGEIHSLSKDYGYILNIFDEMSSENDLSKINDDFHKKYALYLYENDKEKAVLYIKEKLIKNPPEDLMSIFRPKWENSSGSQNSSFALKFKRSENDGLDET